MECAIVANEETWCGVWYQEFFYANLKRKILGWRLEEEERLRFVGCKSNGPSSSTTKREFLQLEKISSSQIILCSMPKKHARCLLERPVTRVRDQTGKTWRVTKRMKKQYLMHGRCHLSSHACVMCREILVLHSSSWCTVAVQWWWEELAIVFSFLEQFVWRAAAILATF